MGNGFSISFKKQPVVVGMRTISDVLGLFIEYCYIQQSNLLTSSVGIFLQLLVPVFEPMAFGPGLLEKETSVGVCSLDLQFELCHKKSVFTFKIQMDYWSLPTYFCHRQEVSRCK